MEQSTAGAADAAAVQLSSAAGPAAAAHRAADHQQSRRLSQHCRPYRRQLLHPACAATTSVSSAPKYKDELCETRWTTSLPVHLKPRGRSWNVHARPYLPKHHAPAKSFESPQTQHSSSCSFPYHYCRPPALSAAALPPTVEPRPSPCRHPHAFRKLITMSSPTSSTSIMFSSSLSSPTSPSAMLASSSPSKPSTVWQGQLAGTQIASPPGWARHRPRPHKPDLDLWRYRPGRVGGWGGNDGRGHDSLSFLLVSIKKVPIPS